MHKHVLFVLAILLFALPSLAQESNDKQRELGVRLSNLNDFGLIYKRQVEENKFIRYRIARFTAGGTFVEDFNSFDIQLAASIGFEKRKAVNEDFDFIWGPEYIASLGFNDLGQDDSEVFLGVTFGYVLGALWHLSDHFYMGLETIPGIGLGYTIQQESDNIFSASLGFNASAVALKAVYKFTKNE